MKVHCTISSNFVCLKFSSYAKFKFFMLSRELDLGSYFRVGERSTGPGSECLGSRPARLDIYQSWDLEPVTQFFHL